MFDCDHLTPLSLNSKPLVTLQRPIPSSNSARPAFVRAEFLPDRGLMVLQIKAYLPGRGVTDLLFSPAYEIAREALNGGPDDFMGNASFSMGGAFLIPFANRIRGELLADRRTIVANILGKRVELPANGGGKRPGAECYAIHGRILASPVGDVQQQTTEEQDGVRAILKAADFGCGWPSSTDITFENVLTSDSLGLNITARNTGAERVPIGIGWHPYFALPSGKREQARLHVPARTRVVVNDYDEVLPTGELVPITGTAYDFSAEAGKALGDLFLDDCFVDIQKSAHGYTVAEIIDADSTYGLRIIATSPNVTAIQVYAPPEKSFIVLEPQFNWADPFGTEWPPSVNTGMVVLEPGTSVTYSVYLEIFTP